MLILIKIMSAVYHVLQLCYYSRILIPTKKLLNYGDCFIFPGILSILSCNLITALFKINKPALCRTRRVDKCHILSPIGGTPYVNWSSKLTEYRKSLGSLSDRTAQETSLLLADAATVVADVNTKVLQKFLAKSVSQKTDKQLQTEIERNCLVVHRHAKPQKPCLILINTSLILLLTTQNKHVCSNIRITSFHFVVLDIKRIRVQCCRIYFMSPIQNSLA